MATDPSNVPFTIVTVPLFGLARGPQSLASEMHALGTSLSSYLGIYDCTFKLVSCIEIFLSQSRHSGSSLQKTCRINY